jgi:hypothetical protein
MMPFWGVNLRRPRAVLDHNRGVTDPSASHARPRGLDPLSPHGRLLLYACTAVIIVSCTVLAVVEGSGWSWPLFLWGFALGPLAIVANHVTMRLTVRYLWLSPEETERAHERQRQRRATTYPLILGTSLGVGIAAGGLQVAWVDLLFTAYSVIAVGLPLVFLPALRRRAQAARL